MPQQVQIETEFALALTSHDYILKALMNEHTLLNNIMVTQKEETNILFYMVMTMPKWSPLCDFCT